MEIERETMVEIAVSVGAVVLDVGIDVPGVRFDVHSLGVRSVVGIGLLAHGLSLNPVGRFALGGGGDHVGAVVLAAKDRVLELLSLGRDMAEKGKEWIRGLARGVRDRASDLVSSFRDMATRAANALKDTFNAIMPDALNIPRISVDLPDALGGGVSAGPWSIDIPQLDTGGRIASDGLAMLHAGERIMPRAQVRDRGPQPTGDSGTTIEEVNITVQAMGDDPVGTGRGIAREFERELSDRGA